MTPGVLPTFVTPTLATTPADGAPVGEVSIPVPVALPTQETNPNTPKNKAHVNSPPSTKPNPQGENKNGLKVADKKPQHSPGPPMIPGLVLSDSDGGDGDGGEPGERG